MSRVKFYFYFISFLFEARSLSEHFRGTNVQTMEGNKRDDGMNLCVSLALDLYTNTRNTKFEIRRMTTK